MCYSALKPLCVEWVHLVFLQGDLAHLSVADEGARHLVDHLSRSHPDDVVGREEARSLSDLPLLVQQV